METPQFVMTRNFNAPPALVWRTWTEPDLIGRWYGPGVETEIHHFELRVGGLWLHEMKMGETSMYQRMEFTEITPTSKLVMLMSNADADWNVTTNPMMPNWPVTLLTTVTFETDGDGAKLTLYWEPHNASELEMQTFASVKDGLSQGWGSGMDIIDEILAELV